jgi:hypothetical protein
MPPVARKYKLNYKFAKCSLEDKWGQVYDQGELGSCVSNSVAGCLRFACMKNDNISFSPSRLFIYYNGRTFENYSVSEDTGLTIEDGYKSVSKYKVCTEAQWPYSADKVFDTPLPECYVEAQKLVAEFKYYILDQDLITLKHCIYLGYPISFGIMLYESFDSEEAYTKGNIHFPNKQTEQMLGGHALTIVGYDDNKQIFIVANSWGSTWGDKGFCYIPYSYILDNNFSSDFCTAPTCVIKGSEQAVEDSKAIPTKTVLSQIIDNELSQILQQSSKLSAQIKAAVEARLKEHVALIISESIRTTLADSAYTK